MFYFYTILIYMIVLIAVGAIRGRQVATQEDFAVAGRKLSVFVLFGTMLATWIGTGSIFGNAEKTYQVGIAAIIIPSASIVGILALSFLAGRVRRLKQITIQDILETRYNAAARLLGAIALILAYTTILSYQYRAAGAVLQLTLPSIDQNTAIIVAAIFIIIYTALAGMYSVAYTDVVMGVTMIIGMLVAMPMFFSKVGGMDGLAAKLPPSHLEVFGPIPLVEAIGLLLPPCLLILGDANMYQRFFAARSEGAATKATIAAFFGIAFMETAIIITAWLASGLEPNLDIPGRVIAFAARDHLPVALGALLLTTIMAIVLSTAIAYLLAPSTVLVRDIYQRFINPQASEKSIVWLSRVVVVLLGVVAYWMSRQSREFLSVAMYAYTIYGASITPSLLAAFLWKRATTSGAVCSILAGTLITVFWKSMKLDVSVPKSLGWNTDIDAVIPAILVSIAVLVLVSLAGKPPDPAKIAPFEYKK
ncbi:MAG TPA: sodium:solute symporter family protein [Acidobacteriota bacterium]|nr:sodium:solute symporter family protein [Acidobacteriota bacterium]